MPDRIKLYAKNLQSNILLHYLKKLSQATLDTITPAITEFYEKELNPATLTEQGKRAIISDGFSKYNEVVRLLRYFFGVKYKNSTAIGMIYSETICDSDSTAGQQTIAWYVIGSEVRLNTDQFSSDFQDTLKNALALPLVTTFLQQDLAFQDKIEKSQQDYLKKELEPRQQMVSENLLLFKSFPTAVVDMIQDYDFDKDNLPCNTTLKLQ